MNESEFKTLKQQLSERLGEPCFETDQVIVFNEDMLSAVKQVDFPFVDLTITSPPYNIGKEYEDVMPIKMYVEKSVEWISEVYRVTQLAGSLLLNVGYVKINDVARAIPIPYLIWDKVDFFLNQEIVWNYGAGVSCKNYLSPRNEKLLWYVKDRNEYTFNLDSIRDKNVKYPNSKRNGKLRVNTLGKNPSDVWQIAKVTSGQNRQSKERTPHPCQFPVDLVDRAVLGFSNEGDLVFDPFIGSGSTIESCLKHNRYCVGIEINSDYCEIAKARTLGHELALF